MKKQRAIISVLILSLASFCPVSSIADDENESNNLEKLLEEDLMKSITPVAPTAASLGRYGDHPVDLSTGLVPINLDLYQIQCGTLTVPISLSYHGGGIKSDQDATWVGLGWDLNFGGHIVRTMNGQIDEKEDYTRTPDATAIQTKMAEGDLSDYEQYYTWSSSNLPHNTFKPDIFSYSIGNYSGTFLMNNECNGIITTTYSPISAHFSSRGINSLISPEGIVYQFGESECTKVVGNRGYIEYYPSTYYVTRIVSPDGADIICYTYQPSGQYSKQHSSSCKGYYSKTSHYDPSQSTINPQPLKVSQSGTANIVQTVKPKTIEYRGGRVSFILSGTKSITGNPQCKMLERIVIERAIGDSVKTIKQICFLYNGQNLKSVVEYEGNVSRTIASFEYYSMPSGGNGYDYWRYYNGKNNGSNGIPKTILFGSYIVGDSDLTPDERYMKHGSLRKIIYPTGGSTEFDWEINRVMTANLYPVYPERTTIDKHLDPDESVSHDKEPVLSRFENEEPVANSMVASSVITPCIDEIIYISYSMNRKDANGNTHRKYDKISLSINDVEIKLGMNEISKQDIYELHAKAGETYHISMVANCKNLQGSFSFEYDRTNNDGSIGNDMDGYPFAGLRIREMIQYDNDGSVLNRKLYEYRTPSGECSGYLTCRFPIGYTKTSIQYQVPSSERYAEESGASWVNPPFDEIHNTLVCSDMVHGPQDNQFAYEYATETTWDGRTGFPVARTEYRFNRYNDIEVESVVPSVSKAQLRGKLIGKDEYVYADGQFSLVRSTTNSYKTDRRVDSQKIGFAMITNCSGNITAKNDFQRIFGSPNVETIFHPVNYTYTSDWQYLENTETTEYASDGKIINRSSHYLYGNPVHAQPTRIESYQGDDLMLTEMVYTADLTDTLYVSMSQKNILVRPVYQRLYQNGNLLGGVRNIYDGRMQKTDVYRILPDNQETPLYRYKYNDLQDHYTLSEYSGRDGIPTSIFWDETYTLPLVIAQGMTSDSLKSAMNTILADGVKDKTYQTLYSNSLFRNALIQTYTYDKKVNLISVTNPSGITQSFDYDGLNRLVRIKDTRNEIINKIEYNYQRK